MKSPSVANLQRIDKIAIDRNDRIGRVFAGLNPHQKYQDEKNRNIFHGFE